MTRTPAHERLLDLVIALTHAQPMMTRAQIRAQVRGYDESANDAAFERMFERDKDTLKDLGIPLRTLTSAIHGDDVGYRIDMDEYELPQVRLSPAELGVLTLAAEAWADSALTRSARRAVTKLRAVAETSPGAPPILGGMPALRLPAPQAALPALLTAITDRSAVAFRYRAAHTGELAPRRVEPWRVIARDRGWYLVGWDRDRAGQRTFRLSRFHGRVERIAEPEPVTIPAGAVAPEPPKVTVTVAVRPERAPALRAQGRITGRIDSGGQVRDIVEIDVPDPVSFAAEVAGYGDAVVALSPPELRDGVLMRLRAAVRLAEPAHREGGEHR